MKRVALAVVLFTLFGLAGLVLSRPPFYVVERTVTVSASPAVAFEKLDHVHGWPAWSKWGQDRVPGSDALSGPSSGVGSTWSWQSKHQQARFGMELLESAAPQRLVFKVLGDSPAKPVMTFDLEPDGAGTKVVARFRGDLGLKGKFFSFIRSPEAIIGPSLERELMLFSSSPFP